MMKHVLKLLATLPLLSLAALNAAENNSSPVVQHIATGEYQVFYLVENMLWGIGANRAGQLGVGNSQAFYQVPPVPITFPEGVSFTDVAAGGYQSLAADRAGHVWTWGANDFGQKGEGTTIDIRESIAPGNNGIPGMIRESDDGTVFDHVISVKSGLQFNTALKNDGSVWVWGLCGKEAVDSTGIGGDSDIGRKAITRPRHVPFDATVRIVQIVASDNIMFARDANGGVWSWGGGPDSVANRGSGESDYCKPHQVANLPVVVDITTGSGFAYAVDADGVLWGWGSCGTYLGLGDPKGGWMPIPKATKLSFPEFGSGRKVVAVAASAHATHVILDDGTLWGWGDSAMGEVGDGTMLDFSKHKHSWDWGKYEAMVFRPVRIAANVHDFKALYTTSQCFYSYAVTASGTLYSWGRNKTGILGNGVLPTGDAGTYPDSWNVPVATQVSPLIMKTATKVPTKTE